MITPSFSTSAAAVAFLTGQLWTTSLVFVNAQQTISECTDPDKSNCAATANRTCYSYQESGIQECGYCLSGFLEYKEECHDIESIGTDKFLLLSEMLETFLPDYVDPEVSTEERALRLIAAAKIISYWNSQVPPPAFKLGLTTETFLTAVEGKGRLGILSGREYRNSDFLDLAGNRGEMGSFEYAFEGGSESDVDAIDENTGDGRRMRLARTSSEGGPRSLADALPAVDWAADGYTTIIKNQGLCGCCWAVATAGAIESALMITGQTTRYDELNRNSLSFQQMISCDKKELGCEGGNILQATRYVWEHNNFNNDNFGGLFSYADWPYTDLRGRTTEECQAQEMTNAGKTPVAYLNFPKVVNSVNDRRSFQERKERLMAAVAQQPVISVLRSGCQLLMNYKDGVLTYDGGCQCCEASCIDHAIVIVGYNATAPTPYWKLRNSWGVAWGEQGYFKIAMEDQGCGWGLFGMLAESALPSEAYKNLEDLPERPGWWQTAATWQKALVILASILGFCCLCGCLAALWNKRK